MPHSTASLFQRGLTFRPRFAGNTAVRLTAVLGLAALTLTGCSAEAAPVATSAPTVSEAPPAAAEPSATPTPTPEAAGTAVAFACDQILSLQDVYDFNPNYGVAPDYAPASGTLGATAVSFNGMACAWSNQTSAALIEISIAEPNDVLMTELKDQAVANSNAVPTYGTPPTLEGYFSVASDGTGEAQAFVGPYWVSARSTNFFEPGDAERLLRTAIDNIS